MGGKRGGWLSGLLSDVDEVVQQTATVDGEATVVIQSARDVTGTVIGAVLDGGHSGGRRRGGRTVRSVTQHGGATYVNGRKVADEVGSLEIGPGGVYVNGKRVD